MNGRYYVHFAVKKQSKELGEPKSLAMRKNFNRKADLYENYCTFLNECLHIGNMEKTLKDEIQKNN